MIEVNGKDFDEHGLSVKTDARRRAGLYDAHMQALLERNIEEELENPDFLMIQVIYELHHALGDTGSGLEPPDDLSGGGEEEKPGRGKTFLRRFQTRFIRAVNEGYVQQQIAFNTLFTQVIDISCNQICGLGRSAGEGRIAARRDEWISRRPHWDGEAAKAVAAEGQGSAALVGIPGPACLEAFKEAGRLALAVDTCDIAVAEAQAQFLPARFHPRPAEVFGRLSVEDLGLMVISFPECLTGRELGWLLEWAGKQMGEGGTVIVSAGQGWSRTLEGEEGLVRWWPRSMLEGLMARHGFEASEWRIGELSLLKGKKSA
jgi:hypothetical protein